MKASTLLFSILCFALFVSSASAETYDPQFGQPHDDFVLPRIDDRQPVWLSHFRGKKVLLIQFASW